MKTADETFAMSRSDIPLNLAATEPRSRAPTCSTTVAHATAATTRPKPFAPVGSSSIATAPAHPAAIDREDVQVSQRPYGARKSQARLATLTIIAAKGP